MRKKGCGFEYQKERDMNLLEEYRRQIAASGSPILLDRVLSATVNSPARRFWVSGRRAAFIGSKMMRGEQLRGMKRNKRLMYMEIYRRVLLMRDDPRYADESLLWLVSMIVEQQAPCFYLTPESAGVILSNIKRTRCRTRNINSRS